MRGNWHFSAGYFVSGNMLESLNMLFELGYHSKRGFVVSAQRCLVERVIIVDECHNGRLEEKAGTAQLPVHCCCLLGYYGGKKWERGRLQ